MKKHFLVFTALFAVIMFTSCLSTPVSNDSDLVELTADNSAVVIFDVGSGSSYILLQNNLETGYGFLDYSIQKIFLFQYAQSFAPVLVGSKLKVFNYAYTTTTGNYIETNVTYYGIAGYDISVDKPGVIFISSSKNPERNELRALKKLAPKYKKTVYYEAMQNRIEELKNKNSDIGDKDDE